MYNVTNANVRNKCLNVHYIACIFAWYMFEWPYTIYGIGPYMVKGGPSGFSIFSFHLILSLASFGIT
jgi:hypothetical protein